MTIPFEHTGIRVSTYSALLIHRYALFIVIIHRPQQPSNVILLPVHTHTATPENWRPTIPPSTPLSPMSSPQYSKSSSTPFALSFPTLSCLRYISATCLLVVAISGFLSSLSLINRGNLK